MANLTTLLQSLKALDDDLVSCMRCGMCQSVCPVYATTMREADVTRGKIALLENLANKIIEDPQGVNEKLNRCLLCGSCQANCPSGVSIMHIFLRARSIIAEYTGLSPVQKIIFRGLLQNPQLFNGLLRIGKTFQGIFVKPANTTIGTFCAPMLQSFIGNRHFPKLADKPFNASHPSLDIPTGKAKLRVLFYPGCVSDKIFPHISEACLEVLQHHGVGVVMPKNLACCGIPSLASGDQKSYHALVNTNMEAINREQFDYLLTPCATCTSTIKEIWPLLAKEMSLEYLEAIKKLQPKVMDINAFVVDVLKVSPNTTGQGSRKITYHDSCHLKKSLGVVSQPRNLLQTNQDYTFVEMPNADACCGSGGSFTLKHYDLSKSIGNRKREAILASGANVVTAGCPACIMQLMDTLSANGDNITVKHPIEIYAATLHQ